MKFFFIKHIVNITTKRLGKVKKKLIRYESYQYFKPAQKDRLVYEHLQSHFKIITRNFKNLFERSHTEKYFIKTKPQFERSKR